MSRSKRALAGLLIGLAGLAGSVGCNELDRAPVDYPSPAAQTEGKLAIALASPDPAEPQQVPLVTLELTAESAAGVAAVWVELPDGAELPAVEGTAGTWTVEVGLGFGENVLALRATDHAGAEVLLEVALDYQGEAPSLLVSSPAAKGWAGPAGIRVAGRAQAAAGASLAELALRTDLGPWTSAAADPEGWFETTLEVSAANAVVVRAVDSQGRGTELTRQVVWDAEAPTLMITAPETGYLSEAAVISVEGTAEDAEALDRVEIQVGQAGWVRALGTDAWSQQITLAPGQNTVAVRATDLAGNQGTVTRLVYRRRVIDLAAPGEATDNLLTLSLDRQGLEALVKEEDAKTITMVYLDLYDLIVEALKTMKDYAAYGVDTAQWGTAEWNMVGLLTMTPDNADLSGSSLSNMLEVAQNLSLPAPLLLAEVADVTPTQPFLTPDEAAVAIYEDLILTHPALVVDPADNRKKVAVTLYDALHDLVPMVESLGPAGSHPGIVYTAHPAEVLLPNFEMTVTAESHLRIYDGIDLSSGKAYLFTKPAGEPVVEFDFLNPEWFSIEGMADEPEVDLDMQILEHPSFVAGGTKKNAGPAGDGFYYGSSPVWGIDPWTFEHVIANAMYLRFHDIYELAGFKAHYSYDLDDLKPAATIDWDRGWLTIQTVAGLGDPPAPQYWWDAVLEIAQLRLHDGGLAEGEANLRMPLQNVRVPLTSEQLLEQVRPVLEAQKDELAAVMVGDHSNYTSSCDFYLATGKNGLPYLTFVAAADLPGKAYVYEKPGFFKDSGLTDKASSTEDQGSGDTAHEKVIVNPNGSKTFYAAEEDGTVYRVSLLAIDGADVQLALEPASTGGTP